MPHLDAHLQHLRSRCAILWWASLFANVAVSFHIIASYAGFRARHPLLLHYLRSGLTASRGAGEDPSFCECVIQLLHVNPGCCFRSQISNVSTTIADLDSSVFGILGSVPSLQIERILQHASIKMLLPLKHNAGARYASLEGAFPGESSDFCSALSSEYCFLRSTPSSACLPPHRGYAAEVERHEAGLQGVPQEAGEYHCAVCDRKFTRMKNLQRYEAGPKHLEKVPPGSPVVMLEHWLTPLLDHIDVLDSWLLEYSRMTTFHYRTIFWSAKSDQVDFLKDT